MRVWARATSREPGRAESARWGTWKWNSAKSWSECGEKPVAERTRVNTPGKFRVETRYVDGTTNTIEESVGGAVERDRPGGVRSVSIPLDDGTMLNLGRKDGQLVSYSHSHVSEDGNTYTFFGFRTTSEGGRCSYLAVMDRVK